MNDFKYFCFIHEPEVKGMLLVTIYQFFFNHVNGEEEGKLQSFMQGCSDQRSKTYPFYSVFDRKGFPLIYS